MIIVGTSVDFTVYENVLIKGVDLLYLSDFTSASS